MVHSDYEKETYKSLILLLLYMIILIVLGGGFLSHRFTQEIALKIAFIHSDFVIVFLAYIIKIKERIYWITTYSYNDAKFMEPVQRKHIGDAFFKKVVRILGVVIIYMILGLVLKTALILDVAFFALSLVFLTWHSNAQTKR
ncbi:hypothetical protein [Fusibacter ferrireducens]|uniref:Uncharacterized protein n=1 Tax=Fusibacter ferrireducens TaxID=2785058 RepID=A0ABR9ZN79_9FIRM|nr:hypothetical protein [Fusibacter ferrireducens]MBF4691932.1 hypothetical protein [Fusibacter ferrireducens]